MQDPAFRNTSLPAVCRSVIGAALSMGIQVVKTADAPNK